MGWGWGAADLKCARVLPLHRASPPPTHAPLQYYFNEKTGENSWTRPGSDAARAAKKAVAAAGLPSGWTVEYDDEGDAYYVNTVTGVSSWYKPNPDGSIPAGV